MNKTRTLAIGLGLATGALLITWLMTGNRKERTKQLIAKSTTDLKQNLTEKAKKKYVHEEAEYYI